MAHYLLHKHSRLVGKWLGRYVAHMKNYPIIFPFPIDSWIIQTATDLTIKQEKFLPSKDSTSFLAR